MFSSMKAKVFGESNLHSGLSIFSFPIIRALLYLHTVLLKWQIELLKYDDALKKLQVFFGFIKFQNDPSPYAHKSVEFNHGVVSR